MNASTIERIKKEYIDIENDPLTILDVMYI
jgi:hypothetical protein